MERQDIATLGPVSEIPAELTDQRTYGAQCQHASWFFLPWHRGYLAAFEAIVAAKVKELTGKDWALPYWNYFDATNPDALNVPDAFLLETLPDGRPNPLRKYRRLSGTTRLPDPFPRGFGLDAMAEDDFVVGNVITFGYGGGVSEGFEQYFSMTGGIEGNPHNPVHRYIGGFMGDPDYAGLDPLFWLHHCNIDRLWEAWMQTRGKHMTADPRWLDGPTDRRFLMPLIGGADPGRNFTGRDTVKGGWLYPRYDNLTKGTGVTPEVLAMARIGLGAAGRQQIAPIGGNAVSVSISGAAATTELRMDPIDTQRTLRSMSVVTPGETTSRLYLALEGVRGKSPSPAIDVYVALRAGENPADHPELRAGSLTLFGLNVASDPERGHSGNGLSYMLDITDLVPDLQERGGLETDSIAVTIVPQEGVTQDRPITVDSVRLYRRSGTAE